MAATRGVGILTEPEVNDFIKASACGVLTVLDGDQPYSVVLEHYYDGHNLYFGSSTREDQRKLRCIRGNSSASYMMHESRREKPEMVKQGIMCRSVLIEGTISEAGIKQIQSKEFGAVNLAMLKLEPREISNWQCPRRTCDWRVRWFERYPELVADL
jgi:nitroimidazol reductase NimA-like FMN-containing flavoprotein (pyridoxamine 5'-phosphate oxidase superfamily)